jgi:pilus assembly protein CpaC
MTAGSFRFWRQGAEPAAAWRLVLLGAAALLLTVGARPAAGQEQQQAAVTRAETIAPNGQIRLEVRKGQVIRLPRPAATVFVADPEIADVQAQSPSIVYLFGRKAGTTSLYAVDERDELLVRAEVLVEHNLTGLRQAIRLLLPDSDVEVRTVDASIVLRHRREPDRHAGAA